MLWEARTWLMNELVRVWQAPYWSYQTLLLTHSLFQKFAMIRQLRGFPSLHLLMYVTSSKLIFGSQKLSHPLWYEFSPLDIFSSRTPTKTTPTWKKDMFLKQTKDCASRLIKTLAFNLYNGFSKCVSAFNRTKIYLSIRNASGSAHVCIEVFSFVVLPGALLN